MRGNSDRGSQEKVPCVSEKGMAASQRHKATFFIRSFPLSGSKEGRGERSAGYLEPPPGLFAISCVLTRVSESC